MKRVVTLSIALSLMALACSDDTRVAPVAERGASLASSAAITHSQYNAFACTTCHAVRASSQNSAVFPGAPLQGAARRPTFWGGEVTHLREAVERCVVNFMRGVPSDLDGPDGQAIGAWLDSLAPAGSTEGTAAVPMTWPRSVHDLGEVTDRAAAQVVWGRACSRCHGAIDTGVGRLGQSTSVLPRDTVTEHCDPDAGVAERNSFLRAIVVEKVRHGSFLGYAGVMPPFSNEVLSDDDVRALTAFFRCP